MKIVKFLILTTMCIVLSGCAGLVTMPKLKGCYSLGTLSVWEQAALHVGHGNPILLVDGERFVCTCYHRAGVGEKDDLVKANDTDGLDKACEQGDLDKADDKSGLGKADEQGGLDKADEKGKLVRADDKDGLDKADDKSGLDKADEQGGLDKADEKGKLVRADDKDGLDKADDKSGLDKADEQGGLDKAAEFSCRIVPECPGFQLIGYGSKQITVLTPAGQKSVPTSCITW